MIFKTDNSKERRQMFVRICVYFLGYVILSLGQRLFVVANLGAASLDAVCVGLEKSTGLSAGTWVYITAIFMIIITAFFRRTRPKYFAIISSLVFGFLFDLWGYVFSGVNLNGVILMQIVVYIIAIILAPLGTAIYFQSKFPKSAIDDLVMSISERFLISIRMAKTICEVFFCILALCFLGPIGVATFVTGLLFGPLLQFFYLSIIKIYKCDKEKYYEVR